MYINKSIGDIQEDNLTLVKDALSNVWTSLPAKIVSYDSSTMTCSVEPTIQMNRFRTDGVVEIVSLPILLDCPVQFPTGGNCVITFPVKKGDECIVIFSSRCIDGWWYSGNKSPQTEQRKHNLSDGMVIVGIKSLPNVIPNISNDSLQIRTITGNSYIEIKESGDMTMKCGKLTIEGDTEFTGSVKANGKVIDDSHTHSGVQSGSSNTGVVV